MSWPKQTPRPADWPAAGQELEPDPGSLPLFGGTDNLPVPHNGSPTSREAAQRIAPTAKSIRAAVLKHIVMCGPRGCTDEECQRALSLRVQTQTARRNELMRQGLVRDSGQRRLTSSGRRATVWVASTGARI